MRHIVRLIMIVAVVAVITSSAGAEYENETELIFDTDEVEKAVPDSARELIGHADIDDGGEAILDRIWSYIRGALKDIFSEAIRNGTAIFAAVVFSAAVSSVSGTDRYVNIACVLTVTAIAVVESSSLAELAVDTIEDISTFSRTLLPVLASSAAISGSAASSAAKYAVAAFFVEILISVGKTVVMPAVFGFIASSVISSAFGGRGAESVASLLKWCAITLLTVIVLVFTLFLSVTGIISGYADAAAVKAAKTTLMVVLPVVGSMISGAAEAVVAGAGLVKGAVGTFGLCVILAIVLIPVIRIGIRYLVYKAAGSLAGAVSDSSVGKLLKDISSAFGIIMGLVGSVSVMMFISIISVIKAVTL